jgi:hypothetical protein
MNSDIHSLNTRSNHDLHIPVANLTVFQKGVWYSGIKIYNHLPPAFKQLSRDIPKFKAALKDFCLQTLFTHWKNIIAGRKDLGSLYYIFITLQLLYCCLTQITYDYTYVCYIFGIVRIN